LWWDTSGLGDTSAGRGWQTRVSLLYGNSVSCGILRQTVPYETVNPVTEGRSDATYGLVMLHGRAGLWASLVPLALAACFLAALVGLGSD
jgi:hypothetical protein